MPIIVPQGLPAAETLRLEEQEVCETAEFRSADPRCLKVLLLNLMPDKPATELQFARRLAGAGFAVELTLLKLESHVCKTACPEHMQRFYKTWSGISPADADGLIITGAPVEHLAYEEINYWEELCGILNDARRFGLEQLHICWAAQAALNHFYGVPKRMLPGKAFGVFPQQVFSFDSPHLEGLSAQFDCPVSRHSEIRWTDLAGIPELEVVAGSRDAGLCLVADRKNGAAYMFNHLEYDQDSLATEYHRDSAKCADTPLPKNYFPFDNPKAAPSSTWDDAAAKFFKNWLRLAARRRMAHNFSGNAINLPGRPA